MEGKENYGRGERKEERMIRVEKKERERGKKRGEKD